MIPLSFRDKMRSEVVRKLINTEILALQNGLVEGLLGSEAGVELGYTFDNISNLFNEETDEHKEVLQWYLVTEWMAGKLDSVGEVILRTDNDNYWGRTCFGQCISNDGTIQKVVNLIRG